MSLFDVYTKENLDYQKRDRKGNSKQRLVESEETN